MLTCFFQKHNFWFRVFFQTPLQEIIVSKNQQQNHYFAWGDHQNKWSVKKRIMLKLVSAWFTLHSFGCVQTIRLIERQLQVLMVKINAPLPASQGKQNPQHTKSNYQMKKRLRSKWIHQESYHNNTRSNLGVVVFCNVINTMVISASLKNNPTFWSQIKASAWKKNPWLGILIEINFYPQMQSGTFFYF